MDQPVSFFVPFLANVDHEYYGRKACLEVVSVPLPPKSDESLVQSRMSAGYTSESYIVAESHALGQYAPSSLVPQI